MRTFTSIASCLITSCMMLAATASANPAVQSVPDMDPLDCVINPSVVADLGSGVPGILSQIHVDRSDFVKAGDVVAGLDSGVEAAALDLARVRAELNAEVDLRRVNAAWLGRAAGVSVPLPLAEGIVVCGPLPLC